MNKKYIIGCSITITKRSFSSDQLSCIFQTQNHQWGFPCVIRNKEKNTSQYLPPGLLLFSKPIQYRYFFIQISPRFTTYSFTEYGQVGDSVQFYCNRHRLIFFVNNLISIFLISPAPTPTKQVFTRASREFEMDNDS